MKAAVLRGQNQPIEIREVADVYPGRNQVKVAVKYAALNHRDVWIQAGRYPGQCESLVLGSDGAGVVESGGEGVDKAWVGKEVIINPSHKWGENPRVQAADYKVLGNPDPGTFSDYLVVEEKYLQPKPKHLSFVEAAALPLSCLTAYRALFTRCQLQPGETVLANGIGGGVALFVLQLAHAFGAKTYVTSSSTAKIERTVALGAAGGFNYTSAAWVQQARAVSGGFDVIIDGAAGPRFSDLVELANPGGRIGLYGQTAGPIKGLLPAKLFWRQLSILGTTMGSEADFTTMVKFCEEKKIKPVIDEIFPLEQAEAAFRKMADGKQFGKIVLKIAS